MNDAAIEFVKLLGNLEPSWVLVIVVCAILAYRSPQILKAILRGRKSSRH
jgi:hypothetical protein